MEYTRVDKLGRIVIPINYRRILGITTDLLVSIDFNKDCVIIKPQDSVCKLCGKKIDSGRMIQLCSNCIEQIKNST